MAFYVAAGYDVIAMAVGCGGIVSLGADIDVVCNDFATLRDDESGNVATMIRGEHQHLEIPH